jgi:hypothetical protein
MGHKDIKFIAADARHAVDLTHIILQDAAHLAQDFIAGGMAQNVVDRLEAVQIQIDQNAFFAMTSGAAKGQAEFTVKARRLSRPVSSSVVAVCSSRAISAS